MTCLASIALLVLIPGSTTCAVEPIPTELEGTWREAAKPGEKLADKIAVTCSGEQITLVWSGATFQGTVEPDPDREPAFFRFTIARLDAQGEPLGAGYNGLCLRMDDHLFLKVSLPVSFSRNTNEDRGRGPVSITFQLEKLKK